MRLSRFTATGQLVFEQYLSELETKRDAKPINDLLTNPQYSTCVDDIELMGYLFKSRFSAATYLSSLFAEANVTDVERDVNLWSWLTAFYFDSICPVNDSGERKVRERAAYIPEPNNFQRYYRHLLLGPYLIYRAHKDNPNITLALLCKPLHVITDIEGQIAATPAFVTNPSVVELTTLLYYDQKTKTTKPGAGGKGPGSPRRLVSILRQFEMTWDLFATTTEELKGLLPSEFENFLK